MSVNLMFGGVGGSRLASGEDLGVGQYQWRPLGRVVMTVFGIHADEMVATDAGDRVPGGPVHRAALPDSRGTHPGPTPVIDHGGVTVHLPERRGDWSREPRLVHLPALGPQG